MRAALVIALVLAACAEPWPLNEPAEPPPGEAEALELVTAIYEAEMGPLVFAGSLTWYAGDCLEPTPRASGCVIGATDGAAVHLVRRSSIAASALAHELMHYHLAALGLPGDEDHSSPLWQLTLEAEDTLDERGL